jgi:hypothetical protein
MRQAAVCLPHADRSLVDSSCASAVRLSAAKSDEAAEKRSRMRWVSSGSPTAHGQAHQEDDGDPSRIHDRGRCRKPEELLIRVGPAWPPTAAASGTFETCPPENVRSPGQPGSHRGPAKPTRMTSRRTLGVGQRAAAREKGSGRHWLTLANSLSCNPAFLRETADRFTCSIRRRSLVRRPRLRSSPSVAALRRRLAFGTCN